MSAFVQFTSGILRSLKIPVLCAVLLLACLGTSAHAISEAGFQRWVKDYKPRAVRSGISRNVVDAAFRNVQLDREVLELARRQPEFTKTLWAYLKTATSDLRVEKGRAMLKKHGRLLKRIEERYGVDRHIVVAVWGMETNYGGVLDNPEIVRGTIQSLATLSYAGGRRSKFGRKQLFAALKILDNGDVTPRRMTGSWAGAMGHTQFIPTTYNAYAVDFSGDGKRDIWRSIPDALGSTANYLRVSRWDTGKTWGYEVILPKGFDYRLADQRASKSLSSWSKLGVKRPRGRSFPRPGDTGQIWAPAGASGPAFLLLGNFRVIKRYNNADSYALAVGHLADRIRGGGPFSKSWPSEERALTSAQRKEIQNALRRKGYAPGKADGKIGPKTRAAIRSFQRANGLTPDGFAGASLLKRLKSG